MPQDWQPKFFQDATGQDDVLFEPDDVVTSTQLGATSTMYHRLKLKAVHRKDMDLTSDLENMAMQHEDAAAQTRLQPDVDAVHPIGRDDEQPVDKLSRNLTDEQLDALVRGAVLRRGSAPMGSLAKELDLPTRQIQQSCARLALCGFLARKAGVGVRYELHDPGAEPGCTKSASEATAEHVPEAHLNAMALLVRLHDSNTKFITSRQVTEKHGIQDKAIAAATLVWLEKQGCLRKCKATIKGREVLKTRQALKTLSDFQRKLEAAGVEWKGGPEDDTDVKALMQEAAARHKAQVAAMYESARAARQEADETPHTLGGANPTNHSANRHRTYAGVTKAKPIVSQRDVEKLAQHEHQKLVSTGALPPAPAAAAAAAASPQTAAGVAAANLSPLNVTDGVETPGLAEAVPAKRARGGRLGQRSVVTAVAGHNAADSPPESVSKTLTRSGRAGKRPRTSTVSMAVRQSSASRHGPPAGGKRTRGRAQAQLADEFSFTD